MITTPLSKVGTLQRQMECTKHSICRRRYRGACHVPVCEWTRNRIWEFSFQSSPWLPIFWPHHQCVPSTLDDQPNYTVCSSGRARDRYNRIWRQRKSNTKLEKRRKTRLGDNPWIHMILEEIRRDLVMRKLVQHIQSATALTKGAGMERRKSWRHFYKDSTWEPITELHKLPWIEGEGDIDGSTEKHDVAGKSKTTVFELLRDLPRTIQEGNYFHAESWLESNQTWIYWLHTGVYTVARGPSEKTILLSRYYIFSVLILRCLVLLSFLRCHTNVTLLVTCILVAWNKYFLNFLVITHTHTHTHTNTNKKTNTHTHTHTHTRARAHAQTRIPAACMMSIFIMRRIPFSNHVCTCFRLWFSILLVKVVSTKCDVDVYSGNKRLEIGDGCHKSGLFSALNQRYFLKSSWAFFAKTLVGTVCHVREQPCSVPGFKMKSAAALTSSVITSVFILHPWVLQHHSLAATNHSREGQPLYQKDFNKYVGQVLGK